MVDIKNFGLLIFENFSWIFNFYESNCRVCFGCQQNEYLGEEVMDFPKDIGLLVRPVVHVVQNCCGGYFVVCWIFNSIRTVIVYICRSLVSNSFVAYYVVLWFSGSWILIVGISITLVVFRRIFRNFLKYDSFVFKVYFTLLFSVILLIPTHIIDF